MEVLHRHWAYHNAGGAQSLDPGKNRHGPMAIHMWREATGRQAWGSSSQGSPHSGHPPGDRGRQCRPGAAKHKRRRHRQRQHPRQQNAQSSSRRQRRSWQQKPATARRCRSKRKFEVAAPGGHQGSAEPRRRNAHSAGHADPEAVTGALPGGAPATATSSTPATEAEADAEAEVATATGSWTV